MWKPDEMSAEATTNNIAFLTRNVLTYSAAGAWNFSACVPLKVIFNFCNDYTKVMWGLKQRIRMTRTNITRSLVRINAAVAANGLFPALTAAAADAVVNLTTLR